MILISDKVEEVKNMGKKKREEDGLVTLVLFARFRLASITIP